MTAEMLFGFVLGVGALVGYGVLGVVCAKKAWRWSAGASQRWARVLLVSFVIVSFFTPGVMAAGHGAAIVPAWLMFASGTFQTLPTSSKEKVLLMIVAVWAVVFAVGMLVSRERVER